VGPRSAPDDAEGNTRATRPRARGSLADGRTKKESLNGLTPLPLPTLSAASPVPFRSVALKPRAFTRVSAGRSAVLSVVAEDKKAVCVLTGTAGVEGTVTFTQSGDGPTTIVGNISGLAAGLHGFHIHEFGYEDARCDSLSVSLVLLS
jgi:hypothetical protein